MVLQLLLGSRSKSNPGPASTLQSCSFCVFWCLGTLQGSHPVNAFLSWSEKTLLTLKSYQMGLCTYILYHTVPFDAYIKMISEQVLGCLNQSCVWVCESCKVHEHSTSHTQSNSIMHAVSLCLTVSWSSFKSQPALWGCTFPWIPGIHVLARMRRWRRWHSGGRQQCRQQRYYSHHDNHHDDDYYDDHDYCIVECSGFWQALRFTMWHPAVNFQIFFLVLLMLDHSCCW